MSSQPQDASTQASSSAAAEQASATQAANAATAQTNSNNQLSTLFGTYNPTTNTYSGGTESQFLNPNSMNTTGLTGSFSNAYNNEANQTAQTAQNAVSTSQQNAADHGMGASPAGYTADQQRQAYQTQAATNGNNYSNLFGAQNTQAVNQYNTANSLLSNSQMNNQSSATANNSGAAGTNTSLYGTASQQVPSALSTALTGVAGLAGGAGSIITGVNSCWVAAEVFDGWDDPRTIDVRGWIFGKFAQSWYGKLIASLYLRAGERTAAAIRRFPVLRVAFLPIFNAALKQARKGR